jgi:competence protein ComFC
MKAQLTKIGKLALDFFLPQSCLGCGIEGAVLCLSCAAKMPRVVQPYCQSCGLPFQGKSCTDCSHKSPPFDGLRSAFRFEKLVREVIYQFKYHNIRGLADPLAVELFHYLQKNPLPSELVIPVPLHRVRLRKRGYNQSELVATLLGHMLGLEVDTTSLKRIVNTKSQTKLERAMHRKTNMKGAFESNDSVKGKKILLIDDVLTSGATLSSCATALKKAGASSVWGLTIAREVQ